MPASALSGVRSVAYSCLRCAGQPARGPAHLERERIMAKQFFGGFFTTLAFVAVVLAALFGIFILISHLAGPVGG